MEMTAAALLSGSVSSFTLSGGTIYQPDSSVGGAPLIGGLAYLGFNVPTATNLSFAAFAEATNIANNSVWIAIDGVPIDPDDIWDMTNIQSGLNLVPVSWRGSGGSSVSPQFPTNVFTIGPGFHYILLCGREANNRIGAIQQLVNQTNAPPPIAPQFVIQPQAQAVLAGALAQFSVVATGTLPLSYQWNFNGAPINGANQPVYTIVSVSPFNVGQYSCTATNVAGSLTSFAATLYVIPPASGPSNVVMIVQ